MRVCLTGVLVLALGAAFSAANAAATIWEFNGTTLTGQETILASASKVTFTIPGLTTTCDMDYDITIWNAPAGAGAKGSATSLSFSNCQTDSQSCTVATHPGLRAALGRGPDQSQRQHLPGDQRGPDRPPLRRR